MGTMTTVTCKQCGKYFTTVPSRIKDRRGQFCSKSCFDVFRKEKPNIRNTKGAWVQCNVCGKNFLSVPSRAKTGRAKYCSKECYYTSKKGKPSGRWSRVEVTCQICGKKFFVEKARFAKGSVKFCSKSCFNVSKQGKTAWNKGKRESASWNKGKRWLDVLTPEQYEHFIQKQSKRKKGKPSWNKGKKWSDVLTPEQYEHFIQKQSESKKGQTAWNKGPRIEKVCLHCGERFIVSVAAIRSGKIKGKYCSRKCQWKSQVGKPPWNKGKVGAFSEETRMKMSKHRKGKRYEEIFGEEKGKRLREMQQTIHNEFDIMARVKRSKTMKAKFQDESFKKKYAEHFHKTKEQEAKRIEATVRSRKGMTKPERYVAEICKYNNIPFHYVGSGKTAKVLFGRYPDFICTDGRKLIIEVMGEYHHGKEFLQKHNPDPIQTPKGRVEFWNEYGYDTLILWSKECLNYGLCLGKIQKFLANHHG